MADVFLSYANEDAAAADTLADHLSSAGYAVWWDRQIHAGASFEAEISRQLTAARVVIVIWSPASVSSEWVKDEATEALEQRKLLPVAVEGQRPPFGFRQTQTLQWSTAGSGEDQFFDALGRAIRILTDGPGSQDRPKEVSPDITQETRNRNSRRGAMGIAFAALAGLAVLLSGVYYQRVETREDKTGSSDLVSRPPDVPSIAILPLADLSEQGNQTYFAQGISEEILNVLTGAPDLRVVGRTSSFQIANTELDLKAIGAALDATYLLEGSVRMDGDRVRVGVQLVDTATGFNVWSDRYDHELKEIFEIQRRIADAVGDALKIKITGSSPDRDLTAYTLYLRGLYAWRLRLVEGESGAIALLERAIARDPSMADAHATLAAARQVRAISAQSVGSPELEAIRAEATAAAERALQLEPGQPLALAALAGIYAHSGRLVEAHQLLDRALQDPRASESSYVFLSDVLRMVGAHEESAVLIRGALENNPHSQPLHRQLSRLGFELGNLEMAVEHGRLAVELGQYKEPASAIFTAAALAELGQVQDAIELVERVSIPEWMLDAQGFRLALLAQSSTDARDRFIEFARSDGSLPWSMHLLRLGEQSLGDQLLLQAAESGVFFRQPTAFGRVFENTATNFRRTKVFKEVARELGVYDHWQQYGWPDECRPLNDGADFLCK
ncbi:MAG: TIR domain-containing protein [Pseudomonadales bacterium]